MGLFHLAAVLGLVLFVCLFVFWFVVWFAVLSVCFFGLGLFLFWHGDGRLCTGPPSARSLVTMQQSMQNMLHANMACGSI